MRKYYSYRLGDKRRIIRHDEGHGGVVIHLDKYRVNAVCEATIKSNYVYADHFKPKEVQWSEEPVTIMKVTTEKMFNYWLSHVRNHVDGTIGIDNFFFGTVDLTLDHLRTELHSIISSYVAPTKTASAHSRIDKVFKFIKSFNYELLKNNKS